MDYRCVIVPESGIPQGETVECDLCEIAGGRLVQSDKTLPVFGATHSRPGSLSMVTQINGEWVAVWESD